MNFRLSTTLVHKRHRSLAFSAQLASRWCRIYVTAAVLQSVSHILRSAREGSGCRGDSSTVVAAALLFAIRRVRMKYFGEHILTINGARITDASSSNEAVHLQRRLLSLSSELVTLRNHLHVGGGGAQPAVPPRAPQPPPPAAQPPALSQPPPAPQHPLPPPPGDLNILNVEQIHQLITYGDFHI